ncbi:hypothetical protein ACWEGS_09465 [Streptomyces sp. NPDC004822]
MITAVRLTGTRLTRAAEPAPPTNSTSQLPAAQAVPGVTGLTGAGHVESRQDGAAALPHRHVRVEIAVDAGRRAVEVAADRAAVAVAVGVVG